LAQEKVDEPSTSGGTSAASTSNSATATLASATSSTAVGTAVATAASGAASTQPSESAVGLSAGPRLAGAESDADLVNPQHLQVMQPTTAKS